MGYAGVDWKSAGTDSDTRSISCALAGRALANKEFEDIGKAWLGFVLSDGFLFRKRAEPSKTYLSLGFKHKSLWAWQVEELGQSIWLPSRKNMSLQEAKDRLIDLTITTLSHPGNEDEAIYEGIPSSPCCVLSVLEICKLKNTNSFHLP